MTEENRMMIRAESEEETHRILDAFAEAKLDVQTETDGGCTLIYVSQAQEAQAQTVLEHIGAVTDSDETPPDEDDAMEHGRRNSIWMTLLLLTLVALAVFGTDAIIEIFRRIFS